MTDEFNPDAAIEAATQPGTFSFVERLTGRGYPTSDVRIYLDEQAAFERLVLKNEATSEEVTSLATAEEVEAKIEELDRRLVESRYVITLKGFPPERYDEIIAECETQYPTKYEEHTNVFSGEKIKNRIENPEFSKLLFAKLWAESIVKIVAPDGYVDEARMDVGTAARVRENFPIDGRRKIDLRIQELRLTSAWIDEVQDEGFLATP